MGYSPYYQAFFVRFGRNSFPPKWVNSFPKSWNSFPKPRNSFPRTQKLTFCVFFKLFCVIYSINWHVTCKKGKILIKNYSERPGILTKMSKLIPKVKNSFPRDFTWVASTGFRTKKSLLLVKPGLSRRYVWHWRIASLGSNLTWVVFYLDNKGEYGQ